ncbi:MAG: DUF3341 domain-containing protein [Verrucomicrobia bacterium]|nr:DUF3341 domain-containing protein [Verrucomicrobiota bacterium]
MAQDSQKLHGLLAQFDTPADLMHAAEMIRDHGYSRWDVFSPFPIHGMDDAMGLKNSKVGWFTFIGGFTGFFSGMGMIWYMNEFNYPLIVGGKPFFSPIFSFPVAYELTILLGAFGTLLGMAFLNRLPRLHNPLLKHSSFKRATDDQFFLLIEASDAKFDSSVTRQLLESTHPVKIEEVQE